MKIKSASFVSALKAAFEQLSVSAGAAVTLNRMILEAEQGNFLLFARFFDNAAAQDGSGVSDGAILGLFKSLTDDAALADAATQAFTKAVAEIGLVGDDSIVSFAKALSDGASSSDAVRLFAIKQVSETISPADDASYLLSKEVPQDAASSSDFNTIAVGKVAVDAASLADALDTLAVGKAIDNTFAAVDALDTVSTSKQLHSAVFATDDVDGAASVLDDQEMQFTKQRTDLAAAADALYRQVAYSRAFSDTWVLADESVVAFGKSITDVPRAADAINVLTGKHAYDIPNVSDAVAKGFSFSRTDSALLGDANTVTLSKVSQDLASMTDTGSLRSQGFSDFTYFAGDYVGASRAF